MSTTGRPESSADASALARRLDEAAFVRVVARPDGDAVAAAGLLGRACAATGTAFQVSVAKSRAAALDRLAGVASSDATVSVGIDVPTDATLAGDALSRIAYDAARELGAESDRALALAGVRAAGGTPEGPLVEGVDRRPGVGLPVADLGDGLAHATLFHAAWSGDEGQTGALLADLELPAELDDAANRRLASRVALDATDGAEPDAVGALEGALRPHVCPDAPFETVEGYADVLDCLAVGAPGLASALALGAADRTDALAAWRSHATATHEALRAADPARYRGVVVVEADAPVWPLARLVRDVASPEPAALAVGPDGAALASGDGGPDAAAVLATALDDDAVVGTTSRAHATFAGTDETETDLLVEGVREAL